MIRVRFAPAPTGIMHIGNVRTALFNYLFAKQTGGKFILRIEDTDAERNFDPGAKQIMADLAWLGLSYDEGPISGADLDLYFQSQRQQIYQSALDQLKLTDKIYRCFCTEEELNRKRDRQIALKTPPRYDQTCRTLSQTQIEANLAKNLPFVWRMKVTSDGQMTLNDLARGSISFELKNFSDYPITRSDGSFNFIFANVIDDIEMRVTHIFRGEDHLTNTVGQLVLFDAFKAAHPTYWHIPIMCGTNGKKLSKRDFGFSLNDLQKAGYLPQAITNYLAIIGGSFEQEIMSLDDLVKAINFEHISATGQIKYDVEKLRWINHKWISNLPLNELCDLVKPFIIAQYPSTESMTGVKFQALIKLIQTDLVTLADAPNLVKFYFEPINWDIVNLNQITCLAQILETLKQTLPLQSAETFLEQVKSAAKAGQIPLKELFPVLRTALTGHSYGFGIHELIDLLGIETSNLRLKELVEKFQ